MLDYSDKQPLRILAILPDPIEWATPGNVGGGTLRMARIFKQWHEFGAEIWSIESTPSVSKRNKAGYRIYALELPSRQRPLGRIVAPAFWLLMSFTLMLKWRIMDKKFDVVVSEIGATCVVPNYLASRLFGIPSVLVFGTGGYTKSLFASYNKLKKEQWSTMRALFQSLVDGIALKLCTQASAFLCVSNFVIPSELGFPTDHIHVTANPIEFSLIDAVPKQEKSIDATFLGRIEKAKGVLDLINAWKKVVVSKPDAKLIFVGTGSLLDSARELVHELELSNNVEFTGYIPAPKKYEFLKRARVFVFPSLGFEGWGMSLAEAMACEVPVVSYNCEAVREVFGKCKSVFFVEKGDVEGMARAILNLVSTKNEDLGKIARDYVLKFDLTNVALEEYEIIQSVLCRKSDR